MSESDTVRDILIGFGIGIVGIVALILWPYETIVCTEEAVILDIVSVSGRDATVFTTKGTFTRNQDRFKNGDTICIKYGKEK